MRFFKKILFIFLGIILGYFAVTKVYAANEFSVDSNVIYDIQDNGKTLVTHEVALENNFSDLYATTYSLGLQNIDVTNVKAISDKGVSFPVDVSKNNDATTIKVSFPDASVGKGTVRHFNISYENSSFAVRTGEVWEVSIPRIGQESNFRNYQLTLKIPKSFGLEAYISPNPGSRTLSDNGYFYTFNKSSLLETGVTAGYGQFQVFSFNLNYDLANGIPNGGTDTPDSVTEIALPPDTAYQKVYIQKITPAPFNVRVDQDGNWMAQYNLKPQEKITVNVIGSVQIFASYRSFTKPTNQQLNNNLQASDYWQINDPKIKDLANELKTPKAIYDYVSGTLHYDSERVQPNVQRMGAVAALENPNQAICMEFTDLFIALARAAGIPAREINGYAYTENPDVQPIGLVADVLHAWPEYYDKEKGVWIPVDPTWGSTTGGVDFFNKLDLRHFAFVIHGADDIKPYPAGSYKFVTNPQKSVYVSFGQLPENRISIPTVSIKPYRVLPFFSSIYSVSITNPGPEALYNVYPTIFYDSVEKTKEVINVLPPYSDNQIQVTLPYSFLGKDMPNIIKIEVGSAQTQILTNKKQTVVYSLAIALVIMLLIMGIILLKAKKIKLLALFAKIRAPKNTNGESNIKPPENTNIT